MNPIIYALRYLKINNAPNIEFTDLKSIDGCFQHSTNTVYINKNLPSESSTLILFHELVHCKQHEIGWLKYHSELPLYFWKKRNTLGRGRLITSEFKEYYSRPHEIQARDISKNMIINWNKLRNTLDANTSAINSIPSRTTWRSWKH